MVAIIYDPNGYLIGTNEYLTEEDDIQLPHFFVEELPPELENIPVNHRVKINPVTYEITCEASLAEPVYGPTAAERITALETNTMLAVTESFKTLQAADSQREQETANTMLALAEAYETILQQQEAIAAITARVEAMEAQTGGES
jgi:hypothetical protein